LPPAQPVDLVARAFHQLHATALSVPLNSLAGRKLYNLLAGFLVCSLGELGEFAG